MSRMLAQRNLMVDWQVAPADWEIVNYDEPKWRYRQSVEKFIHALPLKSLKKKTFVTIATNVLCADIGTKKDDLDPIDRDLYLPLEIALTKWSMGESSKSVADRTLNTKVWLIYPGEPTLNSINHARDHKKLHKIHYDNCQDRTKANVHFEEDLQKVAKEINSMLTPDRIVFSSQLRNCRQDLGSLKWLHRATDYKVFKQPIAVYSIDDLYVVSIRHLIGGDDKTNINQGMARNRMQAELDTYDPKILCDYHRDRLLEDEDGYSPYCAHAITICFTNSLLNDAHTFVRDFGKQDLNETSTTTNQGH